ncbi:MAG: hypothetical protein ABIM89_01535, partial [Mycobacteriales bacterium]
MRSRVVAYAAERLGELAAGDVPPALRRMAHFTPSKRARLAGVALAAAVDADAVFRNHVAQSVRAVLPDLVNSLEAGTPPAAADPYDVAAVAYLLRTPGWAALVATAAAEAERSSQPALAREPGPTTRSARRTDDAVASAREERDKYREQAVAATAKLDDVRRSLRSATDAQRAAETALAAALGERDAIRSTAEKSAAKSSAEARRLKARLADVEAQLEQVRRAGKDARGNDDVRLWLLLESLTNAAAGLR